MQPVSGICHVSGRILGQTKKAPGAPSLYFIKRLKKGGELINNYQLEYYEKNLISIHKQPLLLSTFTSIDKKHEEIVILK